MKYLKSLILALVVVFAVNGCGGGVGGGYKPSSNIFPSDSSLAEANDDNANELIDTLIGYNTNVMIPRSKKVGDTKEVKKLTIINLAKNEIKVFKNVDNLKAYRVRDISENYCESGELLEDDMGSNEIKYTYNNCLQNGYYYDGVIIRKKSGNKMEVNYSENFNINAKDNSNNLIVKGGSKIVLEDLGSNRYKIELNIIYSANGIKGGFEDVEFVYNDSEQSMYQTKGRVYLNDLKEYAVFDKNYDMSYTPLIYDENNNLISGEFYYRFRGADLHVVIDNDGVTYSWE